MNILTPDDLYQLTNKKRYVSQICALAKMHINFRVRPDGSPCVLWSDVKKDIHDLYDQNVLINTNFSR